MNRSIKNICSMKRTLLALSYCFTGLLHAQSGSQQDLKKMVDEDLRFAVQQYHLLITKVPADSMPRSFNAATGQLITSNTEWWTSGFFPGTLWYLYEFSGDNDLKKAAEQKLAILEKEKYYTGNHDLGFMMFCSFGNAYRITKDPAYKDVILTAAQTLTKRYRPSIKAIQSWDSSAAFRCPVIIDNMMNLELLEWAAANGGDQKLSEIAETHANTTIINHFRPDYSTWHVIDYDLQTGLPRAKKTAQGAADSSSWARGQSWGLYGYTMMYRFTRKKSYLMQARHIADYLIHHPNLPADKIPYWDYSVPGGPDVQRDASAGAIMASALLELARYPTGKKRNEYLDVAKQIIVSLSSPAYLAEPGTNGGFLLKHSVGSIPHKSEVDVPLTYADYYFVEALLRLKKWYIKNQD